MSQIINSETKNKKPAFYSLSGIIILLVITTLHGATFASLNPFYSQQHITSGDSIPEVKILKNGKAAKVCQLAADPRNIGSLKKSGTTKASASATYNSGDIESDRLFDQYLTYSTCPGSLTVTIPVGATITSVDVEYDMRSNSGTAISNQRSRLVCSSAGGLSEMSVTNGVGNNTGTYSYIRTGLSVANNVTGGGDIDFELHAGRTAISWGCSDSKIFVEDDTWTVTVYYDADPIPDFFVVPATADVGQPVTFTDDSQGNITSWAWNFGVNASPATASTQGPHVVTYSSAGTKTVSLTVNGSFTKTKTFVVNVNDPVNSVSATYSGGRIPTDYAFQSLPGSSSCPGSLTVTIPVGAEIVSVDVEYNMSTASNGWKSEQRSQLRCVSPGGINETSLYNGSGYYGTQSYSRTGLNIANGVTAGGGINFELHAGRTWTGSWWDPDCGITYNYVNNNTWKITVYFISDPVVNFYADQTSVYVSEVVTFTDISTGPVTSYSWNFGLGANPPTANTQGPHTVTYNTIGYKDVNLTLNGTFSETKENYIFVSTQSGWLKWDDNINVSAVGRTASTTDSWQTATRFEPVDYSTYGNSQITKIRVYIWDVPITATIKIWQGANQPSLVEYVSQQFTPLGNSWNEITLNLPFVINTSQELWFGVEYYDFGAGYYPAGIDDATSQDGKSNMYRIDVNDPADWNSLPSADILGDWNLQAYLIPTGSWIGVVSSVWENQNNWYSSTVPNASTDVIIPITPHDPEISSNVVINTLSIKSGASLTVLPEMSLTVSGNVQNNAGNSGLVIVSDVNGTGSFISTTANVLGTFQRYVKGEPETWHGFSSPMVAQEISGEFTPSGTYGDGTGYDFYTWYEPDTSWIYLLNTSFPPTWATANGSNFFLQGKGYLASYQAENPTLNYVGTFATGNITVPITLTTGVGDQFGSNLVGNPYPSSIDWKAASGWTRNNLDVTGGGYNIWVWNDTAYNYGVYNSASVSDIGTLGVTRHIPPTQGFFVLATQSGNLGMTDNTRINDGSSNWLKSKGEKPNLFFLKVVSKDGFGDDEIMLEMDQDDTKTGAYKRFSFVPTAPSLWIPKNGQYYTSLMIDCLTQYPVLPVSFKAGNSGPYTINYAFLREDIQTALLIDKQTGITHDLLLEPEFSFLASESDNPARFILQFESGYYPDPHDQLPVRIFTYDRTLYIDLRLVDNPCRIEIYNMAGVKTFDDNNDGGVQYEILFPDLQGAYVVRVTGATGQKKQKVTF